VPRRGRPDTAGDNPAGGGRSDHPMTEGAPQHRDLAAGGWGRFSLSEQLGNVGREGGRMRRRQDRGARLRSRAFERAPELLDLTLADPRWQGRRREIARAREALCDAATGGTEYGTTLEDLDRYFLAFAVAARRGR